MVSRKPIGLPAFLARSRIDIALWSGRKSTSQNQAYDHLSANELLGMVREALGDEGQSLGPVAAVKVQPPTTRAEFAKLSVPTAHFTEFGVCVHDFAMLPCPRHLDCLNCDDHVCVKGDKARSSRIQALLEDTRREVAKAEAAVLDEFDGADRFLAHHRRAVVRYEELVSILNDPEIPEGTIVRCVSTSGQPRELRVSTPQLPGPRSE